MGANNKRKLLLAQAPELYPAVSVPAKEALAHHAENAETPGYFNDALRGAYKANRIVRPEGTFYIINVSKQCWYDDEFIDRWVVVIQPDGEIAELTQEMTKQSTQAARFHSLTSIASALPAEADFKTFLKQLYIAVADVWEDAE